MMLSKWRPAARIIGMSPSTTTVRQMMLQWGVTPVWSRRAESTDELIENSLEELKSGNVINSGDLAVITAGIVTYAMLPDCFAIFKTFIKNNTRQRSLSGSTIIRKGNGTPLQASFLLRRLSCKIKRN